MGYIRDGLKILVISLPYMVVSLGCMAGDLVDKSMINSLGAATIAAFGISGTVGYVMEMIPSLIASNSCVMVAREKDNKNSVKIVTDITTTALLLSTFISLLTVLLVFFLRDYIVRLFSIDTLTDTLLEHLLLLRCIYLPIWSISTFLDHYLASKRQNKLLIALDIAFYILLILGDLIALHFKLGGEGIYIATIICTGLFVLGAILTSGIRLGVFRKEYAKEIVRTTLDMLPDRLGQRLAYTFQTKLATSFGTECYAIFVVASDIRDFYEEMCNGLASGWSVYACEWLGGAKSVENTIYSKDKNVIKQTFYYTAESILFIGILFGITVYPLWYMFGRIFSWEQCWYAIFISSLYLPQFLLYRSYYYLLRASGETRCLSLTAIVGGCCVRIPVQLILVSLGGQVGALATGQVLDFLARAVYLRHQVNKSKVWN